jgi:succinoglycan biosynthesis transport protein ExoP
VIVLDTPPVLPVADTAALAPKTDSIIFLTRWRRTPVKAVEAALTLLARVNAPLAGIVLTQVDMRVQMREGYGDAGYYYKSYRSYYVQ